MSLNVLTLRRALGTLLLGAVPGCGCDTVPPRDGGGDPLMYCPTIEEELAAAYPTPVALGHLFFGEAVPAPWLTLEEFTPDVLQVTENGSARVIGGDAFVELRPDGVPTMRVLFPGDTALFPGAGAHSLGSGELARLSFIGPVGFDGESLQWTRFGIASDLRPLTAAILPDVLFAEHFPPQRAGTHPDVETGGVVLHEGSHVWLIRQPRYQDEDYWRTDTIVFVHLIRADGSEPFGSGGLPLRRAVGINLRPRYVFETSYEVGADGSLFYLADWAPIVRELGDPPPPVAPDGDRRGPRMVRVTPDGVVTISPLLVDTGTITGTERGPNIGGVWSALDGDGNYLVHFGVQRADVNSWASVFAKITPDGAVLWTRMTPEPYTAVLLGPLFSDPPVAYDGEGGIAFAMTNGFAPYEIRIGHLDPGGTWLLGEEGMLVESFPPSERYPDTNLYNLEMDVDGEGGYVVIWAHRGFSDRCTLGHTCAMRYDGGGAALWPRDLSPVGHPMPELDYGTELNARHDGLGGTWFMNTDGRGGYLQHVDASGRPLFWYTSRYPPGNACWAGRLPIVAWPDPDAPPIPYWDGAPYEPRPTVDAGSDAGLREDTGPADAPEPLDAPVPDDVLDAGTATADG